MDTDQTIIVGNGYLLVFDQRYITTIYVAVEEALIQLYNDLKSGAKKLATLTGHSIEQISISAIDWVVQKLEIEDEEEVYLLTLHTSRERRPLDQFQYSNERSVQEFVATIAYYRQKEPKITVKTEAPLKRQLKTLGAIYKYALAVLAFTFFSTMKMIFTFFMNYPILASFSFVFVNALIVYFVWLYYRNTPRRVSEARYSFIDLSNR
ncbi:MAG: hypothetical protein MPJ24_09300 [Pirellulaceae bacterium]|nr:hypothetical protein [Pirellulaceae bacterium]